MMKQLTTREEIATSINYNQYPVLQLDLTKTITIGDEIVGYKGSKVRVPWSYNGKTHYSNYELNYFKDDNKICISNGATIISSGFGYRDLMEMVENANTPIIDKNQEFILIISNGSKAGVFKGKTKDYKNINSINALIIDDDFSVVINWFESQK